MLYPAAWEPSGRGLPVPGADRGGADGAGPAAQTSSPTGWPCSCRASRRGPPALFTPAVVSDAADGHVAHLHGLNASRAWGWRRLAESLPGGDPRVGRAERRRAPTRRRRSRTWSGDDYMVEHWLAAYAVLMLS